MATMRFVLAAVVAVGLLVVFVGVSVFYLSWSACLGGESAALTEFSHYADPESGPSPLMGTCEVRYTTQASRKEVLGTTTKGSARTAGTCWGT